MCFFRDGCVTDFLLLQNRHTVHPVHKPRAEPFALIAKDGMYAGFAGAKACHEKITIFQRTLGSEINSLPESKFCYEPSI
jgi:hypothetical protein